ncbi:MAG: hypothetical protein M3M94_00490 [Actinomycetota bacterium]|nr:hypothetical protein [Actinomycetota bacterium]
MNQLRRTLLVLGGFVVAVALFVALRPDGDGEQAATTARTATDAAKTRRRTTATATRARPRPSPGATVIRIDVRGGRPLGGLRRIVAEKGRRIVLIVTSDVADEVHVHGYDVHRDVAPGRPARLAFGGTLVGRFAVELEERKLPIAHLEVRP